MYIHIVAVVCVLQDMQRAEAADTRAAAGEPGAAAAGHHQLPPTGGQT